ncbi:MAG: ribonuclease HII [Bacteroides sp.]|nr:ribonuclease HII [Bacteroides sp.]MCM1448086.1 ribonuclease HII [Bacteroides sp.]
MLSPYHTIDVLEAGCDEAGRGCLAGPVFAAAVILPQDICTRNSALSQALNDSKQLTEKRRSALRPVIEQEALAWAVVSLDNHEIDRLNILRASITAMHHALDQLPLRPGHIIVDGNRFYPYGTTPYTTIVKGDGKYMSIAAASILAKTHRDEYMLDLHRKYPQYAWDRNKGYPSPAHRAAIRQYGTTPYHRMTFNLLGNSQPEFDFGE